MAQEITNILFDMGNVLIRWEPEHYVRQLGADGADAALLVREVYGSVEWVMLDRGSITEPEAVERIRARVPARLRDYIPPLVTDWTREPLQIPGMQALAEELSELGFGMYLLTNAGKRHHSYWPLFPVSHVFADRVMLSADWQVLKPEAAYYEKALELFALDREACLFIDDNPMNVEAALRLGLDGIVFYGDAAQLRHSLREKGVFVRV